MITITTSNLNGIRAAWRKGMLDWVQDHTPDVWCMQEVRAPQDAIDPIMSKIKDLYTSKSGESGQNDRRFSVTNQICEIKGRAGVALVTTLPVVEQRYGLPGLSEDVDSGRWVETDVHTPQGYDITVASVYVHAGNVDDPQKMQQKFRFLDTMLKRLGSLEILLQVAEIRRFYAVILILHTHLLTLKTLKRMRKVLDFCQRNALILIVGLTSMNLWTLCVCLLAIFKAHTLGGVNEVKLLIITLDGV